jgi:hypothetical protein
VETPYDIQGSFMSFMGQQDISKIFHFLIRAGYNAIDSERRFEELHNMKFAIELLHPTNKRINLIVIRYRNLHEYIYTHFDLSGCMTWWEANTNTLQIMYPIKDNTIYVNKLYDIMYATKNCMFMLYQILKSKYFTDYIKQKRSEKPKLFKIFAKRYFYDYLSKIFVLQDF